MRVIAGSIRGRKLRGPKNQKIRPTADRTKEALFNIIAGEVVGAEMLDLFAGTGGIGIEALSRGAEHVVFIDKHRSAVELVKKNLALAGYIEKAMVIRRDYKSAAKYLRTNHFLFDIAYLDPPYGMDFKPIVDTMMEEKIIKQNGLFIVEHSAGNKLDKNIHKYLRQLAVKKYGSNCITLYRKHS